MHCSLSRIGLLGLLLVLGSFAIPSAAHAARDIDCKMSFQLSGWSAFYKTATGSGLIRCNNGQTMRVHLSAKGGGITFGKTEVNDGSRRIHRGA